MYEKGKKYQYTGESGIILLSDLRDHIFYINVLYNLGSYMYIL